MYDAAPLEVEMKSSWLALAAALAAASLAAQSPAPPAVTVLRAARLFDGRGDTLVRDAVVIVDGDKIRAVGARLDVPAGATVIDLGDATLLPGFVDAHTHLTGESSDNWFMGTVQGLR